MQITLNRPDILRQTDPFNPRNWLQKIAIALVPQARISLSRAGKIAGIKPIAPSLKELIVESAVK